MRKIIRYLKGSIIVVLLFLVSCVPITMDQIQSIERGMSSSSFSSMVGTNPAKEFTVIDPRSGLEYQVYIFCMQTGTTTADFGYWVDNVYIPQIETVPVAEDFAFLFYKDSLLFWGFFHEYARSDEQLIERLAPVIIKELEKSKSWCKYL